MCPCAACSRRRALNAEIQADWKADMAQRLAAHQEQLRAAAAAHGIAEGHRCVTCGKVDQGFTPDMVNDACRCDPLIAAALDQAIAVAVEMGSCKACGTLMEVQAECSEGVLRTRCAPYCPKCDR